MKLLNDLKTIPPEALNWLKECDDTWLYGPLQPIDGASESWDNITSDSSGKRPSLKKRSTLETMFQEYYYSTSGSWVIRGNGETQTATNRRAAGRLFRLLPSSILRLLSVSGEDKYVRFSEEVTIYSYI
ncbi:hypothetical protein M441DRAFT_81141 [Trichoderma asperellum CBS 433.97]|uniref:Uncharacterized protein n=1 Tax=Trichoderma asperellum (strain ATCC 204424 / CBS 433.97 / NBRC 101777) TaxID=1042311 RepID=A0A2T3Z6K7_TRIA4|nr:hypothetical protein M441DRAFT_81141 [Trichoderma asperellum CBS 433.97]PTB40437.1 hypothetical protein M441DRAFT_81141 [Trichoderma asperellum CBS 433.97]